MRRSFLRTAITAAALGAAVLTPTAAAYAADDAPSATTGKGELVDTKTLLDGLTGKVYKLGEHTYAAEISKGGSVLGTLNATSGSATIVKQSRTFGNVQVVLASDGSLTSHRSEPGDSLGDLVGTHTLQGGLTARVYKTNPGLYQATVHAKGTGAVLGKLQAGTSGGAAASDTKVFDGVRVTLRSDGKVTSELVDDGNGTLLRTETLSDGSILKVYRVKGEHYRAQNIVDGRVVCTLDATNKSVACRRGSAYIVLTPGGQTYHWSGSTVSGGKLGLYKLPNGKLVKLVRQNGVYGLDAYRDGVSIGVIWAKNNRPAVGQDDVTLAVINPDGSFSNHILGGGKQGPAVYIGAGDGTKPPTDPADGTPQPGTEQTGGGSQTGTQTTTTQTTVVPKGGVAAGAELSTDGDHSVLVASAAGAAAIAAAGLGYVAVARRRTD
ncbi:hypothetical protein [Streptomyces sp. NPDC002328]|uniref:hypothetical protein n=1 Tax=Streptomyces sp. NPDC002328 TaxID=3364642 RepID=UPI0036A61754